MKTDTAREIARAWPETPSDRDFVAKRLASVLPEPDVWSVESAPDYVVAGVLGDAEGSAPSRAVGLWALGSVRRASRTSRGSHDAREAP
jgi:hypothetical protein